jgi:hypothetical protein
MAWPRQAMAAATSGALRYWSDGQSPATWREQGAEATLAAAFETWATSVPVLPAETRAS